MTQTDELHALLKKGPVTALDALQAIGCYRVAARVFDLRSKGIEVTTNIIKLDNGKHIAKYSLDRGASA